MEPSGAEPRRGSDTSNLEANSHVCTSASNSNATGNIAGSRTAASRVPRTRTSASSSNATGSTAGSRTAEKKKGKPVPKDTSKTKDKVKPCPSSKLQASSGTASDSVQERDKDYEKRFKFLEMALEKQSEILLCLKNKMSENVQALEPQGAKTARDKSAHGAQIHGTTGTVSSMLTSQNQIDGNEAGVGTDVHDHDDNFELYSESSFQPDYYYDEEEYGNLPTCGQGNDTANDECDDTVTGGQQAETLSGPGNAPAGAKGFAARFQAKSDMGPKVRDDIADGLKVMLSERLSIENMETIMDKYVPPENVPRLVVPRVNPHIWENIPARSKSRDLRLQKLQKPLVKGMIALTTQMNDNPTPEQEETLALLAHANYELNMFRREAIKPDLIPRFQPLCKPSVGVTEHLFGEDLGKVVKDMTEQQRAVVTKMGINKFRGRRYTPYPGNQGRPAYPHRGRGSQHPFTGTPFLGFRSQMARGRGMTHRGKGYTGRGQRQLTGNKPPATQSRPPN